MAPEDLLLGHDEDEDDSEPPPAEETTVRRFLTYGEWRQDRAAARKHRKRMEARFRRLERRVMLIGLALAALSAGQNIPWVRIAQAVATAESEQQRGHP